MNNLQIQRASEGVVFPMSEEEVADWYRNQGVKLLYHEGHYWKESRFSFYEPIHLLARLNAKEATCPKRLYLGFRASLCEDDAKVANGIIPIHLLSDVDGYDLQSLPSKRRRQVRKSFELVSFIELKNPVLLYEQGYEVYASATARLSGNIIHLVSKKTYLANLKNHLISEKVFLLAGLINDRLAAYITGYAVNGSAYIDTIYVATDALSTSIGTGLVFEFVQACRRSGNIREVFYGYDTPKDPALTYFKEGMGFPVQYIPSTVAINRVIEPFLRWRYPSAYYITTGHN
ncbi:GNAT family N-acetyltransferase [Aerosakkonemataceae cyanobacterium BLCC-F154]|uniref:GNAT family N-acetyltransferase n=1 Tax=Floridaenema fluviatile BLCC-F154 TaxID=3153640 RepID=A0ABV4Y4U9_9CYAN